MNPAPAALRNHSLDALRAAALLLGVVFHAALAYLPGAGFGWAIQDRSTHPFFGALGLVLHSFRLGVFFLLAGYFGRRLHQRLGGIGFVRNRLLRVFVPFVAGWLVVFPLLAFAWTWGAMQGNPSLTQLALSIGYSSALQRLQELLGLGPRSPGFPLTHLWFLYHLLLTYSLFLGGRMLVIRLGLHTIHWQERADALTRFLFRSPGGLPVLTFVSWLFLTGMDAWGVDTPDKTFVPQIPALLHYGFIFALGWLLHRQSELLAGVRLRWGWYLAIALASTLPAFALIGHQGKAAHPAIHLGYQLAYAFMTWSWILTLLGLFLRFRARESAGWRYLADSAYWVYIIHLPAVVILQVALSRAALPCGVKFAIVVAATTLLSLVSYHLLVRATAIGQILNGRRYPFFAARQ